MIKRIFFCIFAAVFLTALNGCHTPRGGSEDSGYTVNTIPSNVPAPP